MHTPNSKKKYFSFSLATIGSTALAFAIVTACTNQQATAKPNIVEKEPTKPGVVAKIGDEEITEEALIGEDKLDFFELKKREYDLRMERLNRLMEEKIIGAEAKKANMPLQEFIDKKVVKGEIKISKSDYDKFVKEKKIPESQITPQIKERIESYLKSEKRQNLIQSYIAKLTKNNPVEVYFKKPRMDVQVEVGNAPTFGKPDAKVTVIEFSDFQCPFCARAADTVNELKKKYGSKIRIAFKHFPLPMHREARPASEAAQCINDQGSDKFWKYHDILFKNMDKLDNASLEKYAKDAGADVAKFKECFEGKKYAQHVQADLDQGDKVGVKSTPTFFVNGQIINGAVPIEAFSEIIDEELKAKK